MREGTLERRAFDELIESLAGIARDADNVTNLVAAYRQAATDAVHAARSPTRARGQRSLQRARQFMLENLAEPLSLAQVARVAGFAPTYFAQLFKREQGVGFEHFRQNLRLERAKTMLVETSFTIERVAQRCGFRSRPHFQRAFREHSGVTPAAYRERPEAVG